MHLHRQTIRLPIARLMLAMTFVCALLSTQFFLNRHVVEHAAAPTLAAWQIDNESGMPDGPSCLTCLEHQAHGAALIGNPVIILVDGISPMQALALPPNTPYLAPERARQRAPPVLS